MLPFSRRHTRARTRRCRRASPATYAPRRLHAALWGLALIATSAWYAYEVFRARPRMAYLGVPRATDWKRPQTWTHVLRNHGFMLGYSELRGNPLWVTFTLRPVVHSGETHPRPRHFRTDWRNLTRVSPDDYTRSGYDRGHMAPNHAMDLLFGRPGQLDSFLMTNVVPQKAELNRKLWERLEETELGHFTRLFDPVWVVTGPLFDARTERLKSAFRVEIPDAFFRIYAAPTASGAPRLLAFVVPQDAPANAPLDRFLASVDTVEALSGLDFFHELEDAAEANLEAEIAPQPWELQQLGRLPGQRSSRHRQPLAPPDQE
ncbi:MULTISPECIES: DNA/RNA non-specific endonuclease [Methylococcus]|uniref:DNA/RNA non-specific endonuclease n=1 Tax=Methylococcus capsulatus TaxID=414 RepID=A0ABZ2F1C0_METCP|nr:MULTISPECIES: DNA/RNA non-specific endonuclease [Methylococcus]